jgi:hypothetical protein
MCQKISGRNFCVPSINKRVPIQKEGMGTFPHRSHCVRSLGLFTIVHSLCLTFGSTLPLGVFADFAQSLNEEEKRGVGEQLNEEELALFDLLTKPQVDMSKTDREKVKITAKALLSTLKESKLVLDWRKRQQARADVKVTIEKLLDQGLPRVYTPELFEQKTTAVFQHVYDAYYGAGRGVYAAA